MRIPGVLCVALLAVAACSPQDVARQVSSRTAATVVYPVVNQYMPGDQASAATDCIVNAATQGQLEALMRDVGTRAGTDTERNVRAIAATPAAQSCLAARGLPQLPA
jgi:predicted lipoprotein